MKSALCREANNEYAPLLHLACCFEEAQWQEADAKIQQLNLDSAKSMAAFNKSVHWYQLAQIIT
jgi:c-di-GMP-related signal transduction protein